MATHYFDNASSGNQYYYNANSATTTSQSHQTYTSPSTSTYGGSGYSIYPSNDLNTRSSNQQIRLDNSSPMVQSFQSVAGFNKNVSQQQYRTPQSPTPQVRASVRVIGNDDLYQLQKSPQRSQVSPQQQHFQFDSRQQPGHATGPAVVYQTPGAAQYTHHNVDLWTENPSHNSDHYVQAQRVSVRPVSTGSPQQSHSISPQRHQDHLQQYYSQLTPEQHQQLLRQQQLQRQQEQSSLYEQQRQVSVQQISPSSPSHQQQHRSTANFAGGQLPQQERGRSATDQQRQNEQDYYTAQRQMVAQRSQQHEEQSSHPVGIRNLMNKFTGPATPPPHQPRSRSTQARQYSSSSYSSRPGPGQTTTSRTFTSHSMTYSALPKSHEPPVNSVEYYQMQQLCGSPFTNIQQAAAPSHIQHMPTGFGGLRDRFKTGSLSEDFSSPPMMYRQQQPQQQQQQQRQPQHQQQQQQQQRQRHASIEGGSTLSSLRSQYMNRAKESLQDDLPAPPAFNISRTIVGEDIPQQKRPQQPPPQLQPAPQVFEKQPQFAPQQQQQSAPISQAPPQQSQQQQQLESMPQGFEQEQFQTQAENIEQPLSSSEAVPSSTTDTIASEPAVSSF